MKVLLAESADFSDKALDLLCRYCDVRALDLNRIELLSEVHKIDVLWTRLRHRVDAELLAVAPRLKAVVTPTTGLNHVDLEEAERRGIHVISLRGETEFLKEVRATAELTVGLLFALLRHVPAAAAHAREGNWNRDLFKGQELYGKTVGVVGFGRLGSMVATYLSVFGATVLFTDPNVAADRAESGTRCVPLSQLLREADIVTLHVNLCRETNAFFGLEQFEAMKEGAWFFNTARGELIDEAALLDALQSGRLAGAALDVLAGESPDGMAEHPLVSYAREHDNLIITPHIGGCTTESMAKTELFLAERLVHWLKLEGRSEGHVDPLSDCEPADAVLQNSVPG
jgi:D-3-phosphoglycerate dehydrogenase